MAKYNQNPDSASLIRDFPLLGPGRSLAGYSAIIDAHKLIIPTPDKLCGIGKKHRMEQWHIYPSGYKPDDTLKGHLTFALKYEGIDLYILNALFKVIKPQEIIAIVESEPTGAYSRRIWFLYEWLTDSHLELDDAKDGNFVLLVNEKLQYSAKPIDSKRHRIRNDLPGTKEFCPLIHRTEALEQYISMDLSQKAEEHIGRTHKDLLSRAAAFLILKDSKASYTIEGESPPYNRIERWAKIIGEAGKRELSIEELEELQEVVISDRRFTFLGLRIEGGFIGEHDRFTGVPIPDHISAKAEDLESLLNGFIDTYQLLGDGGYNPVLMAAALAFGFVFIHPFEDGNGRIHRYLFHHILAEQKFVPKGIVFPVSSVILERIEEYRDVLESYSRPRLDLIEWQPTDKNNVEVLNDTIDLYRYFDATEQAEFLFQCVEETVDKTLPDEVKYLARFDEMKSYIINSIEMPDKMVDLLIRFLDQNDGTLSKRALSKEFEALTEEEVAGIENKYKEIFNGGA